MPSVYHNGGALIASEEVLIELGLKPGQSIDGETMWQVIAANSRAFCRKMNQLHLNGERTPDTADLAKLCGHIPLN